jgi:hypothetical protein
MIYFQDKTVTLAVIFTIALNNFFFKKEKLKWIADIYFQKLVDIFIFFAWHSIKRSQIKLWMIW